jgi:hypothetical protein
MTASMRLLSRSLGPLQYRSALSRSLESAHNMKTYYSVLNGSSALPHTQISTELSDFRIRFTGQRSEHVPTNMALCRWFQTEAEYQKTADATLEKIQDTLDQVLDATSIEFEVNVASGVLNLVLPPHGTWVINKQTPNRQIWVRSVRTKST